MPIHRKNVAMNGFKERILEIDMGCTNCRRNMVSGQKAYTRIEESGITVRMGTPVCHNCAVHNLFCPGRAREEREEVGRNNGGNTEQNSQQERCGTGL